MRVDIDAFRTWIVPGTRVLDLACGDGALLEALQTTRSATAYGLEIDPRAINECLRKGLNVIESDLNRGLSNFPDLSFDTVVMANSLQAMRHPHLLLDEMLRVGKQCIVTFPNFGHWRVRGYLMFRGRMPVTKNLAYQWYDTPNIHFFTISDFEALLADKGINVVQRKFIGEPEWEKKLREFWPNLFAETAIYHLTR